jgi:hypothetical protein
MNFTHVIVTRYNLGLYDNSYLQRPKQSADMWMRHRAGLFRRYCVPSVCAQRCQNFLWLVLFDLKTSQVELQTAIQDTPCCLLCSTGKFLPTLRNWLHERVQTPWIITTRLDNDDALHTDFVHDIQQAFRAKKEVLCFPAGWLLTDEYTGQLRWPSNPFSSLIEQTGELVSVYCIAHPQLKQKYPYRELPHGRWARIVHKDNIGGGLDRASVPVSRSELRLGFPFLSEG